MKTKSYSLMITLAFVVMTFGLNACVFDQNAIDGNRDIITEDRTLDNFDAIDVSGMFKVILVEGNNPSVRIETDENLMEYVQTSVRGNTLELSMKSGQSYDPSKLEAYVTVSSLKSMDLSGATSISADFTLSGNRLDIDVSGASNIDLQLDIRNLTTQVSGAGKIELSGNADNHELDISGAGKVDCEDLLTQNSDISISGAASATVHATEHLKASVSGVGSIKYAGNPESTDLSTSGIGSIKPL